MRSAPKRPASTTAAVPVMRKTMKPIQCKSCGAWSSEVNGRPMNDDANLECRRWMCSIVFDSVQAVDKHFDWQSLRIGSNSSIRN